MRGEEMPQRYVVGFRIANRYRHVEVEGDDALDAAQQVRDAHPDAHITYSRRHNHRADDRHPAQSELRRQKSE
jgi:hypothetical protein